MIVLSLAKCPPSLRGDLTKWLFEISPCVFVGRVSARVRDNLWERICDKIRSGKAIMVFTARNEQGLDFKVHNSEWNPIDFDGLKLMLRPNSHNIKDMAVLKPGYSKASKYRRAKMMSNRNK